MSRWRSSTPWSCAKTSGLLLNRPFITLQNWVGELNWIEMLLLYSIQRAFALTLIWIYHVFIFMFIILSHFFIYLFKYSQKFPTNLLFLHLFLQRYFRISYAECFPSKFPFHYISKCSLGPPPFCIQSKLKFIHFSWYPSISIFPPPASMLLVIV